MADSPPNSPHGVSPGDSFPPSSSGGAAGGRLTAKSHWLCSELVTLAWSGDGSEQTQVANLEEIWPEGAMLDAEEFVPEGSSLRFWRASEEAAPATLHPGSHSSRHHDELHASVSHCRRSATGYAMEVEFHAGSEWSPERLPLVHAVNSTELQSKASGSGADRSRTHAGSAESLAADRATDEALEQGSLFCLALHANQA
ncbi:MAG: hypothetical protein U5J83_00980 [Bryobacterales bacterium]|nr:hypothetical protein [Bryobacterales bacterium]